MSKKNLAKTAIEGGRHRGNKWERRNSHNEERLASRDYCKRVIYDPEFADEDLIEEKTKVYKEFTDKLGPMYRWLRSQIGRPWNEVRSDVSVKFDTRTTAGRHIVYDHLLKSVETDSSPTPWWRRYYVAPDNDTTHYKNDFYVDDEGILRERKYLPRSHSGNEPANTEWIAKWLKGRVAGRVGQKLYWFTPVMINGWTDEWKCQWERWSGLKYLRFGYESVFNSITMKSTYKPVWREPFWSSKKIAARQYLEFSKEDYEVWKEMPEWCHKQILEYSPTNN